MTQFSIGKKPSGKIIYCTRNEDRIADLVTKICHDFNFIEQFEALCVFEYLSARNIRKGNNESYYETTSDQLKLAINKSDYKKAEIALNATLSTDRVIIGKGLVSIEFQDM